MLENLHGDKEPEHEWSIHRNTNTFKFLRDAIDPDKKLITPIKITVRTDETPSEGSTAMTDLKEMLKEVVTWAKQRISMQFLA